MYFIQIEKNTDDFLKKLQKREIKQLRKNSVLWANLYDFEVVAYKDGKEIKSNQFTFSMFMDDVVGCSVLL